MLEFGAHKHDDLQVAVLAVLDKGARPGRTRNAERIGLIPRSAFRLPTSTGPAMAGTAVSLSSRIPLISCASGIWKVTYCELTSA
jgi:hypothetical protein